MQRWYCLIIAVVVSSACCASAEPKWYKSPPSDGSEFMYSRGYAEKKDSRLEAIDAALQESLSRFARRICVTIEDDVRQRVTETTRRGKRDAVRSSRKSPTHVTCVPSPTSS